MALVIDFFNLLNESLVCVGTGVFGLMSVVFNGNLTEYLQYIGFTAVGAGIFISMINLRQKKLVNQNDVIIITGCDSGLGFNLAMHSYDMGMFVVAACLSVTSDGALKLKDHCDPKRFLLIELDIRRSESVLVVHRSITDLLKNNTNLKLNALVNNAGVMAFGEFEWQTDSMIEFQIEINLLGTIKFTKEFLPIIRKHQSRIITVTSHCALEALPGLAPYGATKAGLKFWNDALRVELKKYGVDVVNFIPGSFTGSSSIAARQQVYANEMLQSLSEEQLSYYGNYFNRYNDYLKIVPANKTAIIMNDPGLLHTFQAALTDIEPKSCYKYEPWRYTFYHILFSISPTCIRDWLVIKFMSMPQFDQPPSETSIAI